MRRADENPRLVFAFTSPGRAQPWAEAGAASSPRGSSGSCSCPCQIETLVLRIIL